jgi:YqaJ-like viral recombinase domain
MSRYLISDAKQGSDEWKHARAGKATGSRARDILAKIKTGEAAARRDYRIQLITERLTGAPADDGFITKEMMWGTEQEPFARMAYEINRQVIVHESGFAYLPDIQAGCSVDGFVEDFDGMGIVEYKCPKSATHIGYLMAGRLPPEHEPQVLHNLWITGASFADFASFDPRLPDHLQLFVIRVQRDEEKIKAHEAEVLKFLAEVDEVFNQLSKKAA